MKALAALLVVMALALVGCGASTNEGELDDATRQALEESRVEQDAAQQTLASEPGLQRLATTLFDLFAASEQMELGASLGLDPGVAVPWYELTKVRGKLDRWLARYGDAGGRLGPALARHGRDLAHALVRYAHTSDETWLYVAEAERKAYNSVVRRLDCVQWRSMGLAHLARC